MEWPELANAPPQNLTPDDGDIPAVTDTLAAKAVHLSKRKESQSFKISNCKSELEILFEKTYSFVYSDTLKEGLRAPLLGYKSASFPISTNSRVTPAALTAGESKAFLIAWASRKAAEMLFWPKLTPQIT